MDALAGADRAEAVEGADALAGKHRLDIVASEDRLIPSTPYRAVVSGDGIVGTGSGETAASAKRRATMEWFERHTQFAGDAPAHAVDARQGDLRAALDPRALGLYSVRQYSFPQFACASYREEQCRRWVPVRRLRDGVEAYVPIEFLFPKAHCGGLPLVRETSSGTAAAPSVEEALRAAVCEAIERDALMRWWYRQEPASLIAHDPMTRAAVGDDLEALASRGLVVAVARLPAAAGVPCFVACAQQRCRSWVGSACALDAREALRHAMRELAQGIGAVADVNPDAADRVDFPYVRNAASHHLAYQREPFASVVRAFFATTLRVGLASARLEPAPRSVSEVCAELAREGFETYTYVFSSTQANTPPVVRALVAGLVPFHVGFGMERLGCHRLTARTADGRLRTLLPHCFP